MHACFKEAHIYIYRVSPFVASSLVCEKKKVTCVIIDPVACASRIIVDLDQGILGRRCLFNLLDPCHDFLMEINNQLTHVPRAAMYANSPVFYHISLPLVSLFSRF